MKRKEIVLIKETRQSKFVNKVMDSVAPYIKLVPSDKLAIKINLSGFREIYANTHYETVESLIFYLKDNFGISDISVIEGADGAYYSDRTTWDIFYKFRYKEVELNGAKLVNLDELPHEHELEVDTISGKKVAHYTKFEADYIISVIPPKTHNIFPVFLSIPNFIGFVKPDERSLLYGTSSSEVRKVNISNPSRLAKIIDIGGKNFTALLKEFGPSLVLVDGLYGMEGNGPIKGSPVFHGFSVASEDPVLADALTTHLMGFDVADISYIDYAFKAGLGNNRWQNVVGVDPAIVKFPYRPHPNFQLQKKWKDFRRGPRDGNPNHQHNNNHRNGSNNKR